MTRRHDCMKMEYLCCYSPPERSLHRSLSTYFGLLLNEATYYRESFAEDDDDQSPKLSIESASRQEN